MVGVKAPNEMTIGRTDDPENPFGSKAFKAAFGTAAKLGGAGTSWVQGIFTPDLGSGVRAWHGF
jgi:hypothetical protein